MFKEDYVKENKVLDKTKEEHQIDLYKDLENSKIKLNSLYKNLNYANRRFSRLFYLSN